MIDAKHLHIRFDKIYGFIRVYDGTRYLVLFGGEKYDSISRVRCPIGVESGATHVISHNYAKIKVDLYNLLPPEKPLTLHNVITLIKAVFDKDRNNYYHNIFLEKGSYQLLENNNNK